MGGLLACGQPAPAPSHRQKTRMNRLQAIRPFGQRIWLDNLSRDLLRSGELSRWIDEDGIAGVTSNPAIFHKTIRDDVRYVSALQELKALPDLDAEQRYEQLVIPDIQAACDLLEPQYRASQGDDGYVSLEVSAGAGARRRGHGGRRPPAVDGD